ncbi:branched-chain amino acid transport system substrate-binding protein [Caldalkalibacillus uzonensis]|uniref:Branched-chain amino acid transport system substrate-binding protein n=1 Tax=Caldalkalibacillus uzonensis TaxID=353224 RepID=A0ABU0CVK7_9BACI|nr:ABC transporter substrate-binding protein [Caldalkalibacillus uzonensis]MDQ0339931.1 branched-chain amino acid transport system substrate-binding protein [Caldalkalibacillus uzonensis]
MNQNMKKKGFKHWWTMGMMVLAAVLLLAACGQETSGGTGNGGGSSGDDSGEVIRIGGIFDITGGTGDVGEPYAQGAKAYFEYVNEQGGLDGKEVKLFDIDYAYDVSQALEAYRRLTQQDKVIGILGWGTGDTEAMKELIAEDKIPYISGSYSENLTNVEEHPYNFLSAATYSDQARTAIHWFVENWTEDRPPRMALLYNDTPFGRSPVADAKAYAESLGVEVVDEQVVDITALDASSQLLNMRSKEPDFALIQQTWGATATILKDAQRLGIETQFLGLNWAAGEGVIPLAGDAAEGFIGVIPHAFPFEGLDQVPGLAEIEEYLENKGKSLDDINQKFVQGWHSAKVMLEGARLADELTGEGLRRGLEQLNEFDTGGLGAPVTFTEDNHRGTTAVRLAQVKDGQWEIITDYISYEE